MNEILNKILKQRDLFSRDYEKIGENKYRINNFTGYAYVILQYEEGKHLS